MPDDLEIPVAHGQTVTLRPHALSDVDAVLERCVDPDSIRWTSVPTPYTRDMAQEYVESIIEPSPWRVSWAIEKDGRYAGTIDLRVTEGDVDQRSGDLGFVTHPRARGQGVMTEAVALVIDHAFGPLGWELLVWQANVGNIASYKPMWRNGFPLPLAVPALLNQRGTLRDGWHSVLEPGMSRQPQLTWDEVDEALSHDVDNRIVDSRREVLVEVADLALRGNRPRTGQQLAGDQPQDGGLAGTVVADQPCAP